MRSPFKFSALFLTSALAMGMTGQANALDVSQKGSFAQIQQELSQERQVEVARAKYILHPEDRSKTKVLCVKFTVSASGEGYILMSDNMDDSKARIEMVYGKLKNVRVYDPRNVGILPQGVSAQSNLAALIKQSAAKGNAVFVHGQSVKKAADGTEQVVGSTTVMANVSSKADSIVTNSVGIWLTSSDDVTSLDKVVATELEYRSLPTIAN